MSIDFSKERWQKIEEDYSLWWTGKLGRPLIHMVVHGRDPQSRRSKTLFRDFASNYELSVPAEDIIDAVDYNLSTIKFIGDAFPSWWPNFGPGVAAAFLGATLTPRPDTAWFHQDKVREITEQKFTYDKNNVWLKRIKDICKAGIERWQGMVQIGMTDLGGTLDVLSSFRPSEGLLTDLCTNPDDVKRLTWDIHREWWKYFDEINAILKPVNPGYTAWMAVFSTEPFYVLQCDFSYMISPEMFEEFVKPELAASCKRLKNALYHLDGPGQLAHLDSLLSIPELKAIQWVPGEGRPGHTQWPQVYRKIRDAGKLIQLWGDMHTLDALVEQLGSSEGIIIFSDVEASRENEAREFLKKYKVI
jgi:hypothetical protein